jgi:DNA polymerase-3 subunit epsilon
VPQCLKNRTFARLFSTPIAEKMAFVVANSALPLVLRIVAARWRQPSWIFAWNWIDMEALRALLVVQPKGVAVILRLMCEDYGAMRDGSPI